VEKFPILSMSADSDTTSGGAAAKRMFEIVNNMRSHGPLRGSPHPVLRLFDIYIKQCGDKDMAFMFVMPFRDEDTVQWLRTREESVQMLDAAFWQALKLSPDLEFFKRSYKQLVRLMRPYLINLISKHYLLPEILSVCSAAPGSAGSCLGHKHFVRIQFDHYRNRESSKDIFGFHKDTVSCNTFRVALSFQNPVSMYGTEIIQCHSSISEPGRCEQVVRLKLPPYGTISFNDFLLAHSSPSGIQEGKDSVKHPGNDPVANMRQGKVKKAFMNAYNEGERDIRDVSGFRVLYVRELNVDLLPVNFPREGERARAQKDYNNKINATAAVFAADGPHDGASAIVNYLVEQAMTNEIGREYLGVGPTSLAADPTLTVEVKDLQREVRWVDERNTVRSAPEIQRPPFFRLWFEVCDHKLMSDAKTEHTKVMAPLYLIIPIDQLSLDAGMGVLSTNTVREAINSLLSEGMATVRTGGMKKKKKRENEEEQKNEEKQNDECDLRYFI